MRRLIWVLLLLPFLCYAQEYQIQQCVLQREVPASVVDILVILGFIAGFIVGFIVGYVVGKKLK